MEKSREIKVHSEALGEGVSLTPGKLVQWRLTARMEHWPGRKGYYLSASLEEHDGSGVYSVEFPSGMKSSKLEETPRFSAQRLQQLAAALAQEGTTLREQVLLPALAEMRARWQEQQTRRKQQQEARS